MFQITPLFRSLLLVAVAVGTRSLSVGAEPPFKIEVDYTAAPECEAFATKAQALATEWYPKINEILFGPGRPLPTPTVKLIFRPMKGVAYAQGSSINIAAEWIKRSPEDYGMVVHEMTHIVQSYHKGNPVDGWVTEGIADFVRHQHYEKDPEVITKRVDARRGDYHQSYTVSAAFLCWLEANKNKELVRKLNVACNEGGYKVELFQDLCGAPVDDLWKEFVSTLPERK